MELNDNFILSGEEIDSLNLFDSSEESEVVTPKQDTKEVIEEKPPEETSTTEEKIEEDTLFASVSQPVKEIKHTIPIINPTILFFYSYFLPFFINSFVFNNYIP